MENWKTLCALDDIPALGSRVVKTDHGDVAVFRTADDRVFALKDRCPHKGGPLSQGIVSGERVTCPMHGWQIELPSGAAIAPDKGCAKRHEAKVEGGQVYLRIG